MRVLKGIGAPAPPAAADRVKTKNEKYHVCAGKLKAHGVGVVRHLDPAASERWQEPKKRSEGKTSKGENRFPNTPCNISGEGALRSMQGYLGKTPSPRHPLGGGCTCGPQGVPLCCLALRKWTVVERDT